MSADSSTTASFLDDGAVERHDLARLHEDAVAGRDDVEGHGLELAAAVAMGLARRAFEEGAQLPPGPAGGPRLEGSSGGEHDADHRAGELLVDDQCAHQGQQGDHVDAESAVAEPVDHPPGGA